MWVICVRASPVAGCQPAACLHLIVPLSPLCLLFLHEAILDCAATPLPPVLVSSSVPASLVSIHPSTHLAGARCDGPSGAERGDGATAGAQSDKERQITPLTRTIHHRFISHPFPSSAPPSEIQRTWTATPETNHPPPPPKKKTFLSPSTLFSLSRNSRCSSNQRALLLR